MLRSKLTIPLFLVLAFHQEVRAQIFSITQPNITSCTGALLDSGGEGASGYSDNENFTTTICPDGPDAAISISWITWNISTDGPAPIDQLVIYDGASTNDPILGTFTGNDNPGVVSASLNNPTGCLTLVWTSNSQGTGVFAASITCFVPCAAPTAVATLGQGIPALVCQNEMITFDASASFAAPGFSIVEYHWDFADGVQDSLSGAVVQHAYDEPGEYVVQVVLTDDNGCQSTNFVDLVVWVSTTPSFQGTTESLQVCQGDTVDLLAVATPTTWTELPFADFGDGIYLPDEFGVPFNSIITYNDVFQPGAVLTDIDDLLSVCVSMEHSFMGDLVISLTCPNGQTVTFHEQGGGGTFIGDALDGETVPPTPGTCWDYCWSPTATNGTWVDNSFNSPLPSGTYESLEPMSQLLGCPLNGTWTFTVVDLWSIDDGFLCSWNINFDPSLYPDLTEFTPILGTAHPDSAGWTGPQLTQDPNDPLHATVQTPTPGIYDYTFWVTDNFGCTYDTTITVTVDPVPQGPILISGDAAVCDGVPAQLTAPAGYDSYLWSTGDTAERITVQAGIYTVTVAFGNCPAVSEPFAVTISPSPEPVIVGTGASCDGAPSALSTSEAYQTYLWSTGSTDPSILAPTGTYTVTVTNDQGCSATSGPFDVVVGSDPTALFQADPPSPQLPGVIVDFLDASTGNGSVIDAWAWSIGNGQFNTQNVTQAFNEPGIYTVMLVVTTVEGCQDTLVQQYVIQPGEIFVPNVFSPNGDGLNDNLEFTGVEFYPNSDLKVFNRWGQVVYESTSYRNQWKPGKEVPEGTYYFVLSVSNGETFTGHVTLVR
ncbi:MAG: gliding motility-associated C-terminal domain-containing protein [Flavobacteriales bacterium]|nr:gliding motility-associated C-terminal domain-containing protein [Flavobacteriales bacterium]